MTTNLKHVSNNEKSTQNDLEASRRDPHAIWIECTRCKRKSLYDLLIKPQVYYIEKDYRLFEMKTEKPVVCECGCDIVKLKYK